MESKQFKDLGCEFGPDVVSYLYDELASDERLRFEDHLLGCALCTDEFAEFSAARFEVYEWHKTEFVPMPTPTIVIPYAKPSFLDAVYAGVRHIIANVNGPAIAFASVTILAVAALLMFALPNRPDTQVAVGVGAIKAEALDDQVDVLSEVAFANNVDKQDDLQDRPSAAKSSPRTVLASTSEPRIRRERRVSAPTANERPIIDVQAKNSPQKEPKLSDQSSDEDNSLRLSDLFAEGDDVS